MGRVKLINAEKPAVGGATKKISKRTVKEAALAAEAEVAAHESPSVVSAPGNVKKVRKYRQRVRLQRAHRYFLRSQHKASLPVAGLIRYMAKASRDFSGPGHVSSITRSCKRALPMLAEGVLDRLIVDAIRCARFSGRSSVKFKDVLFATESAIKSGDINYSLIPRDFPVPESVKRLSAGVNGLDDDELDGGDEDDDNDVEDEDEGADEDED